MVTSKNKFFIGLASIIVITFITFFIQDKEENISSGTNSEPNLTYKDKESSRYEILNKSIIIPSASNKFFKKLKIDINANFNTLVFKENGIVYLGIEFDKFNFIVHQNSKKTQTKADSVMFEPFLLTLVDGGKIDDIHFSNRLDENQKKQLSGLIYTLQFSFKKSTLSWSDSEKNSNGIYKNLISSKIFKNEITLNKKNTEYISYNSKGANIEIMKSNIKVQIDSTSWIKSLNFKQEELYSARGNVMMRARYSTYLKRVRKLKQRTLLSTFSNTEDFIKYLNSASPNKNYKKTNIDLLTPKKAVHSFFLCMKVGKCNFLDISHNLMAYLILHPDAFEYVLELIKDKNYAEYHHRLINMLRDLGTPLAQKAILEIIGSDEYTQSNKTQAAVSIGFLNEPTDETIEHLQDLRESGVLGEQEKIASYYALGNLASGSQEAYEKIAPKIIEDLKKSDSVQDTINALGALENTENNDVIKYVTPYLNDNNRAVRRGAAEALRLTDAPEATQALYKQLKYEEYDLVINSIAFSLNNKKDLEPEIVKEMAKKSVQKIKKSNDTMMVKAVDFLVKKSKENNKDAKDALKKMMGKNLSIEAKKRIIRGL